MTSQLTVWDVTYDLLRELGLTTMFGNPGSTEQTFLKNFPGDFSYILGLQEASVLAMADGFAQSTGKPALVNLHTAPGLGNGMGAIFNAQANKSPVVVTAGQQYRSLMTLQANLQSSTAINSTYVQGSGAMTSGAVTPDFTRTINVYDSQGGTQPLQVSYLKTGANTWSYEVSYQGAAGNITGNNPIAQGSMSFNSDGTLANADNSSATPTGSVAITIPWSASSGLAAQTVSLNMGTVGQSDGVTQYDSASTLTSSNVDGALFGSVSGVSIDSNGYVTANFTNGLSQKIYKLPIATFANEDGLAAVSGNAYAQSATSGGAIVGEADTGAAGTVQSGSLESSTVDLATEFTNLITTQRAYEASTRIITTASDMLDQLLQMSH